MRILLCFFLLLPVSCFAQQTPGESFIGVQYSGMAYRSQHYAAQPWNSGFGITGHLGAMPHFGMELALDKYYIREVRSKPDTVYTPSILVSSLRFGYQRRSEKWSWYASLGPKMVWGNKGAPMYLMPEVGLQGMRHLTPHLSAFLAVYGSVRVRDDNDDYSAGHAPNAVMHYQQMDGRFFFWGTAGIGWRGIFKE